MTQEDSGYRMTCAAFSVLRKRLGKNQRELADILGVSLKAVESYEQGWRKVPANIERILYFLLFKMNESAIACADPCWETNACGDETRKNCVTWLTKEGHFCWFFTGRLCAKARAGAPVRISRGIAGETSDASPCYACPVFSSLLRSIIDKTESAAAFQGETPCP